MVEKVWEEWGFLFCVMGAMFVLSLKADAGIKKYIKMQGFRFGFPKGLLCIIIKQNLDAWQFAG